MFFYVGHLKAVAVSTPWQGYVEYKEELRE
jgi:hypothetical protein